MCVCPVLLRPWRSYAAAEELEDARKIETREHEQLAIVRSADDPLMDTSTRDDEDEIIECKLPGERFLGK